VEAWRNFSMRKDHSEKKKKLKFGVHAPQTIAEDRPKQANNDEGRPMGIQTEYKKLWR